MKTLEEAIGCWTVGSDGLDRHARAISSTVHKCSYYTKRGRMLDLAKELELLTRQMDAMNETLLGALNRFKEIVDTEEVV